MEGRARPMMEANAVDVTVFVRVLKDPNGVLWHNSVKFVHVSLRLPRMLMAFRYDSKLQTGYVGIKNQGKSAFISTNLQVMFCLSALRKVCIVFSTALLSSL